MPRLKPTSADSRIIRFKAEVQRQMVLYGIDSITDLSIRCGMNAATFYRKMKAPESFSGGELRKIYNVLHFTDEQRLILCK